MQHYRFYATANPANFQDISRAAFSAAQSVGCYHAHAPLYLPSLRFGTRVLPTNAIQVIFMLAQASANLWRLTPRLPFVQDRVGGLKIAFKTKSHCRFQGEVLRAFNPSNYTRLLCLHYARLVCRRPRARS